MRVLAVTNLYPTPYDPIRAPFNRQQFRALAGLHPVRVICPIAWTEELPGRRAGGPALPRDRQATVDGIPVDHPRYYFPPRILRSRYGHCYRASIRRTFHRAVAEFRPDVVLGTWAYPDGWAAVHLAREAGLPVAIKVHGCDVLWGLRQNPARIGRTGETLRGADLVIAVSNDLARNVADFGVDPDRIRVVYNGVDADRFHPGPKDLARARVGLTGDVPNILFVGALVPVKGLDYLNLACARLHRHGFRFRCHLIGTGPLGAELQGQARNLGLHDVVHFHGPKPHDELPDWYRGADLFVLPSRSEGVPGVLMEAMACGTPFVASRVGGVPEVADLGNGRLAPPGDIEQMADAIREVLTRPRTTPTGPRGGATYEQSAERLAECLEAIAIPKSDLVTV
jgi:glycosyltransferase involved in cell wall biosynthesis